MADVHLAIEMENEDGVNLAVFSGVASRILTILEEIESAVTDGSSNITATVGERGHRSCA